jgi:hypothetical protein
VLSQNVYSVLRNENEHKFRQRAEAGRGRVALNPRVLRPSTIVMMRAARDELAALVAPAQPNKKFFLHRARAARAGQESHDARLAARG